MTGPNRDVRLLVGAVGLSALGDLLLMVPLVLHIESETRSGIAVSAFFLALWGPAVLLGGAAGSVVDRFENARLLALVSLAQAGVVVALGFADSVPAILVLTAALGAGVALSQPAEFALVPAAAGEGGLARANGHVEAARSLGMTAGPLLGAALAAAGQLRLALLLDAASFVIVACAVLSMRAHRRSTGRGSEPGAARAAASVRDLLGSDRILGVTLGAAVGSLAFFSMSITAEIFFVTRVLDAGEVGYGLVVAAWMLGMVAGAVGLAHRVRPTALAAAALGAVAVQGAGIASAAAASAMWMAMAGFAVGGVAHGVKNVLLRTLIHERTPERLRGRAFAAYNAARNGAELGALAVGGVLVGAIGARGTLALAGAMPLLIGALSWLYVARRPAADRPTTRRASHVHAGG
jgi:MFS family permease